VVLAMGMGATVLHRRALAWCAAGVLVWAQFHWLVNHTDTSAGTYLALAWGLIALGVIGDRYFSALRVPVAGPFALAASTVTFVSYIFMEAAPEWVAVGLSGGAAALLCFCAFTRGRTALVLGLGALALASVHHTSLSMETQMKTLPLVLGFVAPAVVWIAVERAGRAILARIELKQDVRPVLYAFPAIATGLLVLMLFKLPLATTYYLTLSWSGLGVALFVLAVAFREKTYRYCGLAVVVLAFARAFAVDVWKLEPIPRVLAFGGIGVVAMALSFGYWYVYARLNKTQSNDDQA